MSRSREAVYTNIGKHVIAGFTNQFCLLLGGLSYAIDMKVPYFLVSPFRVQINMEKYTPISNILDLSATNSLLGEKYGIQIVDCAKMNEGVLKQMKIREKTDMSVDESDKYVRKDRTRYLHLLQTLHFSVSLVLPCMKWTNNILDRVSLRIPSVIHLRLEEDSVNFMATKRKTTPLEAKRVMEEVYISHIHRYLSRQEPIIILTGDANNRVMKYLRREKYKVHLPPKLSSFHEVNAVANMIIGRTCGRVFIGSAWSTFSQVLQSYFGSDDRVRCVMLKFDFFK